MLLLPLLQTLGVVTVAFLLSNLLSVAGRDLWLLQSLLWYAAIAALIHYAWRLLEWWNDVLIVTDKRVMITTGIVGIKSSAITVNKVTGADFELPWMGKLLGYGTVRVRSAGLEPYPDLEEMEYLPRAREIREVILRVVFDREQPPPQTLRAIPRG